MSHPHPNYPSEDRLARYTFSDPIRAAGLLQEFLPPTISACLELDQIKLVSEQHITKDLKERRDDLNLECPLRPQGRALLRILIEHKSCHDPGLWLQLNSTITQVWKKSRIAPVIPIVLHTGPETFRYSTPASLHADIPKAIQNLLPSLPIISIDISRISLLRLEKSPHLDEVAKVVLSIMKLVQSQNVTLSRIRKVIRKFYPDSPSAVQRDHLDAAITYIRFKSNLAPEQVETMRSNMALAHPINPKSAFAQELREERAKGIAKGIAEGIAKGIIKGKAEGKSEGRTEATMELARKMHAKGMDAKLIAELTGITDY